MLAAGDVVITMFEGLVSVLEAPQRGSIARVVAAATEAASEGWVILRKLGHVLVGVEVWTRRRRDKRKDMKDGVEALRLGGLEEKIFMVRSSFLCAMVPVT